jgi:hypothetical protein
MDHLLQGQGCRESGEQGRDRSARLCETHTAGQQRPGETSGRDNRATDKGAIEMDHLLQGQGCRESGEQGRDRSARLCETHTAGKQRPGKHQGRTGRDIRQGYTQRGNRDGPPAAGSGMPGRVVNRAGIDLPRGTQGLGRAARVCKTHSWSGTGRDKQVMDKGGYGDGTETGPPAADSERLGDGFRGNACCCFANSKRLLDDGGGQGLSGVCGARRWVSDWAAMAARGRARATGERGSPACGCCCCAFCCAKMAARQGQAGVSLRRAPLGQRLGGDGGAAGPERRETGPRTSFLLLFLVLRFLVREDGCCCCFAFCCAKKSARQGLSGVCGARRWVSDWAAMAAMAARQGQSDGREGLTSLRLLLLLRFLLREDGCVWARQAGVCGARRWVSDWAAMAARQGQSDKGQETGHTCFCCCCCCCCCAARG